MDYLVEYRGGHNRRQPIGDTVLGTFNHPAVFLHVHLYQVFKLIWRGQRPYSYAKPVRRTVATGEARQKSGFCPGRLTRWFLKSAFLQQLDTQESKEHHGLLFSYLLHLRWRKILKNGFSKMEKSKPKEKDKTMTPREQLSISSRNRLQSLFNLVVLHTLASEPYIGWDSFFPGLFLSILLPRWCSLTTQATHPEASSSSNAFRSIQVWKANLLITI